MTDAVRSPSGAASGATAIRGGVLVVDKPAGPTSHDVVAVVRRACRATKVGHTGTLDPFATGVLPLVVGRATRLAQFFTAADKQYDAGIRLGRATDTFDVTGTQTGDAAPETSLPSAGAVTEALERFVGPMLQVPPPFSAKQSGGIRAYEHARRGIAMPLEPSAVTLHGMTVLSIERGLVRVRLVCSAGYYVRSLAHDLGVRLGVGAHLESLRRTRSGPFLDTDAVSLEDVVTRGPDILSRLVPLERLLPALPAIVVTSDGVDDVRHGRDVGPPHMSAPPGLPWPDRVRLIGPDGLLCAVAVVRPGPVLHPAVVVV